MGDADGLNVVYDDEAQLILEDRERLYGRRGLTIDAYEGPFLRKKPIIVSSLHMVFYTNQRVVGLRDMTKQEEELYLGTLRALDRDKFLTGGKERHHVLSFFEYPLQEVVTVKKAGKRHLRHVVRSGEKSYEFRFRPWGAACRFFSILLRKEEQG